jgi:hypothetical protein
VIGPKTLVPAAVIAVGLALVWPLDRLLVATTQTAPEEERLYMSDPETIRHLALGYDSLLADIYWVRAVQYFGTKVLENPNAAIEKTDEMPLLYPMIDITTTLEPHYLPPYRLGGYFLYFSSSPDEAFRILERGIEKNPNNVRLYQDLAFFEWNAGRCDEAARRYQEASKLPGAPSWLASSAAVPVQPFGSASSTHFSGDAGRSFAGAQGCHASGEGSSLASCGVVSWHVFWKISSFSNFSPRPPPGGPLASAACEEDDPTGFGIENEDGGGATDGAAVPELAP